MNFLTIIRKTKIMNIVYQNDFNLPSGDCIVYNKTVKGLVVMSFGSVFSLKPADTLYFVASRKMLFLCKLQMKSIETCIEFSMTKVHSS